MSGTLKTIGVDALPIVAGYRRGGGIGRYVSTLFEKLVADDSARRYIFFLRGRSPVGGIPSSFLEGISSARTVPLPDTLQKFFWSRGAAAALLENIFYSGLDAYVSTAYFTPRLKKSAVISFVYDLTPFKGVGFDENYKRRFGREVESALARCDFVLTISENSMADIVERYKIPSSKIRVVYPELPERFNPDFARATLESTRKKYSLPERYALSVGVISPNKNFGAALDAFDILAARQSVHRLVVVGRFSSGGEYREIIAASLARKKSAQRVMFLPYVADDDMPAVYAGADAIIFPSHYEGFGLPVLEAMACGVPVVASRTSSIPEVAGNAGLLFEPADSRGMGEALCAIAESDRLREELGRKGVRQAEVVKSAGGAREFSRIIGEII